MRPTEPAAQPPSDALRERAETWRRWLFDAALPIWLEKGVNPQGGFFDRLTTELEPTDDPLRFRVQGRQTYVFAEAGRLGWRGPWRRAVEHGADFLLHRARLPGGFVAPRYAQDGSVLESSPDLYDQAFALLGFASAYDVLREPQARTAALQLAEALAPHRTPEGGYRELGGGSGELMADPQMHLLEAALAWAELDDHPVWRGMIDGLTDLCVRRLVDPASATLCEIYVEGWTPAPGDAGRRTEPGHHFEWASLLMEHDPSGNRDLARRLCERAEGLGVDAERGVAVNAIDVTGAVLDPAARLWPQTERLRAVLTFAAGDDRWTASAVQAADSLALFTRDLPPGLWGDLMDPQGFVRPQPAPASSLYHLTGAVSALIEAAGRDA